MEDAKGMVRSMTGFGRSEYSDDKRSVAVEIKSVNYRYNDVYVRLPAGYSFAEDAIKKTAKKYISRGKTDVYITIENTGTQENTILIDTPLAKKYADSIRQLGHDIGAEDDVSLQYIASLPNVIKEAANAEDEEEMIAILTSVTSQAAENHMKMRDTEGKKLKDDILNRAGIIEEYVAQVEKRAPHILEEYEERLHARITELLGQAAEGAEERIITEVAIFAEKINVTEEVVRLGSHIKQLRSILNDSEKSEGKKLDFLMQEMNREANTIGSKANDLETTNIVIEIKSEIEKIREQVQNIE